MINQPVHGDAIVPNTDRSAAIGAMEAQLPKQAPAIKSLWPPMYFVAE